MRLNFLIPILLVGTFSSFAQSPYFQQQTDYRIDIRLDDQAHVLHGHLNLIYHNNAPEALDTLYFHLWPNAYRNQQTAYAKQARRMGETDFHFAREDQLGGIDSLSFTADGEAVTWGYHPEHIDIAILVLPQPLPPDAQVEINTPFRVDLPYIFSRLGHVNQSYSITQWYPKPAVYDNEGWHPMPYLDMGEFYSEFGNYEVSITLPENYQVGATGTLQNEVERQRLLALSRVPLPEDANGAFPPSAKAFKTLMYTAENVHDFAWFADKRFQVRHDTATLPSGKTVEAWAFFAAEDQDYWDKGAFYVKRALEFYSEKVGAYPYPQATAVQTTLGAGGGMEYPMVTNIGGVGSAESLDMVITHEIGHNWFYGILASNERDHAWMDEGLNSYYEERYAQTYYTDSEGDGAIDYLLRSTPMNEREFGYLFQARRHLHQPPETHSNAFKPINYLVSAYILPPLALDLLEGYAGTQALDSAMHAYYQKWQFRHPQPGDLQQSLEEALEQDLDWLFGGLMDSKGHIDYAITKVENQSQSYRVEVANRGTIESPVALSIVKGDTVVATTWSKGFSGKRTLRIDKTAGDLLVLDAERHAPELYRRNNYYRLDGPLKWIRRPDFTFLPAATNDTRGNILWSPALGWNNYDKLMAGLILSNHTLPEQRLEWRAAPMYGFGSRDLTGLGALHYNIYPRKKGVVHRIRLGLTGQRFSSNIISRFNEQEHIGYERLQPYLRFDFTPDPTDNTYARLQLRGIWLRSETLDFRSPTEPLARDYETQWLQEARFTYEQRRKINPYQWSAALEHQAFENVLGADDRYVKAAFEIDWNFNYSKREAVHLRVFAGYFLYSTFRESQVVSPVAFNLSSNGGNDYRFDDLYLGRNETEGIWSQQISRRDGGFKVPLPHNPGLGRSNNFILAANFKADLPSQAMLGIPLKPYLDIGYFSDQHSIGGDPSFSDQFMWNGGLMLELFDERLAVYFPLISSKNIADQLEERGDYFTRIGFQLDLQRMNPWKLLDRQEL
ncbi:M1 family metallopeptidase [Phaeodactylibacter sp.]|uniref:M1 family metallopeptidase n=1 Tax=Phaeodactylibacter sp. TaxID=1940289 RepID=UPI0025E540A2|nr:M1 family metallopeptidase [Phaeodactylibacter sp.]MCI4648656.1 M1 family metallopeptidase [Phaeodactylibacter sp.]MCI5091237.1 M1 family metallopeptidase [Phaeodactylibacter sp.]